MSILDRKIPSFLGLAIIVIGIASTTFLIKGDQVLQINAGSEQEPENIETSNISDSSFTITYTTDGSAVGSLKIGETLENLNLTFLDDRDKTSNSVNKYQTHIITAHDLKPETTYYYEIVSGDKTFSESSTSTVKTAPIIGGNPNNQTVTTGKMINPDGSIPNDAIVIIKINGAQPLSAIIDNKGIYSIPLNNIRSFDLGNFYVMNEKLPVNIDFYSGNLKSQVNLFSDQISNIPLVTASNNYDFSDSDSETKINKRTDVKFPEFDSKTNTISKTPTRIPSISPLQ